MWTTYGRIMLAFIVTAPLAVPQRWPRPNGLHSTSADADNTRTRIVMSIVASLGPLVVPSTPFPAPSPSIFDGGNRGSWTVDRSRPSAPPPTFPVDTFRPTMTGPPPDSQGTRGRSSTASALSTSISGESPSGDYMNVANKWREAMGHPRLTRDATLEENALKTVQDGNGQMTHELNPGSMAQVLAPGNTQDFENVYVGGWLCEVPNATGLNGICSTMSAGWSYEGQTGHANILNSKDYSRIGCAYASGIWGCDLA